MSENVSQIHIVVEHELVSIWWINCPIILQVSSGGGSNRVNSYYVHHISHCIQISIIKMSKQPIIWYYWKAKSMSLYNLSVIANIYCIWNHLQTGDWAIKISRCKTCISPIAVSAGLIFINRISQTSILAISIKIDGSQQEQW